MVLHYDQIVPTAPAPGITRRILARGGAMMGVEASFKKRRSGSGSSTSPRTGKLCGIRQL